MNNLKLILCSLQIFFDENPKLADGRLNPGLTSKILKKAMDELVEALVAIKMKKHFETLLEAVRENKKL